jgi:hypothetical protein
MADETFYGNPEALRVMNQNVSSFMQDANWRGQVSLWNDLVQPEIDSHLRQVFSSWPDPDDGVDKTNPIATLWLLKISIELQYAKTATNTTGAVSGLAKRYEERYTNLLEDIKAGRAKVPGAVRSCSVPTGRAVAKRKWTISEDDQPDEPEGVADKFTRGLRR